MQRFLLATLLGVVPAVSFGQDVVSTTPACSSCKISRRIIVQFGADRDGQQAAPTGLIGAVRVHGGFLAMPWTGEGPLVFSSSGDLIKVLGKSGRGPGEYVRAQIATKWRGDSILIFDPVLARLSVLAPSLAYVRSIALPAPSIETLVAMSNGELIANAFLTSHDALGYPIHVLDVNGKVLRSFGTDEPVVRPDRTAERLRLLATDGRTVWSAMPMGRYVIEEWNPETGRRTKVLRRRAAFFPESDHFEGPTPTRPPAAGITGLYHDDGLVWVFVTVADPRWARGLSEKPIRGEGGALYYAIVDKNKVLDTIVEVFDTRSGTLLASQRFGEYMTAIFAGSRMGVLTGETPDGGVLTQLVGFKIDR